MCLIIFISNILDFVFGIVLYDEIIAFVVYRLVMMTILSELKPFFYPSHQGMNNIIVYNYNSNHENTIFMLIFRLASFSVARNIAIRKRLPR